MAGAGGDAIGGAGESGAPHSASGGRAPGTGGQVNAAGGTLGQGGQSQGGQVAKGGITGAGGAPALKKDGEVCGMDADCSSRTCRVFYTDADGDGYGVKLNSKMLCGSSNLGYANREGDCCDTDSDANPGITASFGVPTACGNYDYDCSKTVELYTPRVFTSCSNNCSSSNKGYKGDILPGCGDFGQLCSCDGCTEVCNQVQQTCR